MAFYKSESELLESKLQEANIKKIKIFFRILIFTSLLPEVAGILHLPSIGIRWTGVAWITMFLVSLGFIICGKKKVTMPYLVWLPWFIMVIYYCIDDLTFWGVQASLQYICFPVVGFAASTLTYDEYAIQYISKLFVKWSLYIICGFFLTVITGLHFVVLGAPGAMTLSVIGTIGLSLYFIMKRKWGAVQYWISLLIVFMLMTRTGIAMLLLIGFFHPGNKKVVSRILFAVLACIAALIIIHSDSFMQKSFGDNRDVESMTFEDLNTNGRTALWTTVTPYIERNFWFGNGCRADYFFLKNNGYIINEFHNDFLAVLFDYGFLGIVVITFAMLLQFLMLYSRKPTDKSSDFEKVIYSSAAIIFLSWVGFAFCDNALKYSIQFGNFHWVLIGMYYSMIEQKKI